MQRTVRGTSQEDTRGLLADAEVYDDAAAANHKHHNAASLQEPKDFEEFETDDQNVFEDDYAAHDLQRTGPPSVFDRLRTLVSGARGPRSISKPDTSSVSSQSPRWRRTMRAVFNYPEANMDLRSTAWLDGVRGLAAFEVFIYHYAREWVDRDPAWGPEKTEYTDPAWYRFPFIRTFYNSGHASVAVFFAISGYVLSHRVLSLLAQGRHEDAYAGLSSAIFRRAIRLFSPAAIWTFIVMILCWTFDGYLRKVEEYTIEPTLFGEISYWASKVLDMLTPVNYPERWVALMNRYSGNVTWTISLEYYGSIVVFCALLFTSRTRSFRVRQCLFYSMIVLSFLKDDWVSGQFLLGMSFADWQLHGERQARLHPHRTTSALTARAHKVFFYVVFIFGWFMAGLPMSRPKDTGNPNDHAIQSRPFFDIIAQPIAWMGWYGHGQWDNNLYALAGICILVGVGENPFLKKLMEARFVQYLGKISFGFYLVHVPIRSWLGVFDPIYFGVVGMPYIPWDEREESFKLFVVWMIRMGPAIVICLIAGGLFERWIDKPIIRFSRRFEQWCLSFGENEGPVALPHAARPGDAAGEGRAGAVAL